MNRLLFFSEIINLIDENNKLKVTIRDLEHQKIVSELNYDNLQDKYKYLLEKLKNINIVDSNKLKVTIRDLEHQKIVSELNYDNIQDKYEYLLEKLKNINIDDSNTPFQCACDEKNCTKLDEKDCCGDQSCCEESQSDFERDQFWNSHQDRDSDNSESDKDI